MNSRINRIKKRKTFFKSSTFASKLFIKLAHSSINPIISCVSILKFEPQNRTRRDMEKTLPWLSTLDGLTSFLYLEEQSNHYKDILIEFAMILFYQYTKPNSIIKRFGEKNNFFFLVMNGELTKLELEYCKECISDNEYIIHLIKLTLIKEFHLVHKIIQLNQDIFPFNDKDIETFCNKNKQRFDYNLLHRIALQYLSKFKIDINNYKYNVPNINDYIEMTSLYVKVTTNEYNKFIVSKQKGNINNKKYFLIPHFIKTQIITNGNYFGDLLLHKQNIEDAVYISNESCDLGYINKSENYNSPIFSLIQKKMKKIFENKQKLFYIFQNVPKDTFLNQYAGLISYKKYHRGDKLIIQNTLYSGVFLIQDGEFEVYSYRSFDELDGLVITLQNTLEGFNEYISSFSSNKTPLDNFSGYLHSPIYQTNEFLSLSKEKKKISLMTINNKEAIGLNEYYNYKSKLYHFTVECISEEAFVYFISKEAFNGIVGKEKSVHDNLIQLVELKIHLFTQTIKRYKDIFIERIRKKVGIKIVNNMNITTSQFLPRRRYNSNQRIKTEPTMMTNSFRDSFTSQKLTSRFSMKNVPFIKNDKNVNNNRSIYLNRGSNKKVSFISKDITDINDHFHIESIHTLPPIIRKTFRSSKTLPTRSDLI